jgi:hypothetical protein
MGPRGSRIGDRAQQVWQLGNVQRDAPRLVAGEQMRRRAPSRLVLGIDIGERLPVVVADDEADGDLIDGLGRCEAGRTFVGALSVYRHAVFLDSKRIQPRLAADHS